MPNYCYNTLTVISYDDAEHSRFWQDARDSEHDLSFESLLPMPTDWNEGGWYEWNTSMWGTKWDVCDFHSFRQRNPYITECEFSTALSPPDQLFWNIRDRYPRTTFIIEAQDPDMDIDAVIWISTNDDECIGTQDTHECAMLRLRLKERLSEFFEHPDAE